MPKPDDFEIIDERHTQSGAQRQLVLWLAAILTLILFGFATGIAYIRVSTRLADPTPTRPDGVAVGMLPTPTALPMTGAPADATPTVTPTTTGTPPVTPSPTPSTTPTPACVVPVAATFAPLEPVSQLGCALREPNIVWTAYEPFERGSMLWRSDTDDVYAFFDDGAWMQVNERWTGQEPSSRGAPPPGLFAPERGFGYVWGQRDDLFARLGWARDREKGFCAEIQEFTRGVAIAGSPVATCTADDLFNHAATAGWTPLLWLVREDGVWRDATAPAMAEAAQQTRPPAQGVIYARRPTQPLVLDGSLDDWPGQWLAIDHVVQVEDAGAFVGGADLAARFQVAWSDQGLVIAARVQDDLFRPGPTGTALWQGDGVEIHVDSLLSDDYTNASADGDDFQIGLAPPAAGDGLRSYRWLPFAHEGVPGVGGMAVALRTGPEWRGYHVEALIPWPEIGLAPSDVGVGRTFGFNISINDNDGADPGQQTVLSFSPARTTHDDPTEWATLILTD